MVTVADERDMDAAEAAFFGGGVVPGFETVLRVRGGKDYGALARVEEFFKPSGEGFDLSWADEGPGAWEEDQDQPVGRVRVGAEGDLWEGGLVG